MVVVPFWALPIKVGTNSSLYPSSEDKLHLSCVLQITVRRSEFMRFGWTGFQLYPEPCNLASSGKNAILWIPK